MNTTQIRGRLSHHIMLDAYTAWRVGGVADKLYKPADLADLKLFLSNLTPQEPLTWLGLGSNVLIRQGGVRGTVILTQGALADLRVSAPQIIRAEAGVTCAKLAKFFVAVTKNSQGIFFAGIPGTVGGALAMNAGAFGSETWAHVGAVETIDRHGQIHYRLKKDFQVGYRQVKGPADEWFVAGYFYVSNEEEQTSQRLYSAGTIQTLLKKRSETQPIGTFNCGSVFRNPDGDYAARLIEQCGLKGKRMGGAVVSNKHANFILNDKQATAVDIEALIELVEKTVKVQTNVTLIRECHIIGEF